MCRFIGLFMLATLAWSSGCDRDAGSDLDSGEAWIANAFGGCVSVVVHTVDYDGAPQAAQTVTWRSASMERDVAADCADEACTTWNAGQEVAGEIAIVGVLNIPAEEEGCWLYQILGATATVPMGPEGQHVVTQDLTLTFDTRTAGVDCDPDPGA